MDLGKWHYQKRVLVRNSKEKLEIAIFCSNVNIIEMAEEFIPTKGEISAFFEFQEDSTAKDP